MGREQIFLRGDTDFTLKGQWPSLSLKSLHSIWWASGRTRDTVGAFLSLSEGNATASWCLCPGSVLFLCFVTTNINPRYDTISINEGDAAQTILILGKPR